VSCVILAGGKSKRLGRNKATETIGESSLLEIVVSRLSEFNGEIIIVTAHDSTIPQITQYSGVKIVEDIYPGKGTLGGIFTGLVTASAKQSIVVGCDMPFINRQLLRYMLAFAGEFDAVVPRATNQVLEPLHAIYSRACIEPVDILLKQNRLSVLELYPIIKVKYVEAAEIKRLDPEALSFFNINTKFDLQAGREIALRKDILNDKR
jgi:molybdenum cofactor guanylyltransferase